MMRDDQAVRRWYMQPADVEQQKALARETHIAQLLDTPKLNHIPEQIFIKPLHPDPAQHLERLAVFLMFRTRFSNLPHHQQNVYSRGWEKVRLFEMLERGLVAGLCGEYGVDLGRVQLLVDELWMAKVFLSTSRWVRDLRLYTDEDLRSERFKKAVGLPVQIRGGDEQKQLIAGERYSTAEWMNTQESKNREPRAHALENHVTTQSGLSSIQKQKEWMLQNMISASEHGAVGARIKPPVKSRLLTITSATSLHGGRRNVYNPSVLRQPKFPLPHIGVAVPVASRDQRLLESSCHDSRSPSPSAFQFQSQSESRSRSEAANRSRKTPEDLPPSPTCDLPDQEMTDADIPPTPLLTPRILWRASRQDVPLSNGVDFPKRKGQDVGDWLEGWVAGGGIRGEGQEPRVYSFGKWKSFCRVGGGWVGMVELGGIYMRDSGG